MANIPGRYGGKSSFPFLITIVMSFFSIAFARIEVQSRLMSADVETDFEIPYKVSSISAQAEARLQFPATTADVRFVSKARGLNTSESRHAATLQQEEFILWLANLSEGSIEIKFRRDAYEEDQDHKSYRFFDRDFDSIAPLKQSNLAETTQGREVESCTSFIAVFPDLDLVDHAVRHLIEQDTEHLRATRLSWGIDEAGEATPRRKLRQQAMKNLMQKARDYETDFHLNVIRIEELSEQSPWSEGSQNDMHEWAAIKTHFADARAGHHRIANVSMYMHLGAKLITGPVPDIAVGKVFRGRGRMHDVV